MTSAGKHKQMLNTNILRELSNITNYLFYKFQHPLSVLIFSNSDLILIDIIRSHTSQLILLKYIKLKPS